MRHAFRKYVGMTLRPLLIAIRAVGSAVYKFFFAERDLRIPVKREKELIPAMLLLAATGCGVQLPPANLSVVQASDLGTIPTNPDILGRDGGYSAVFGGYSVWLYSDTFLAQPNAEDFTLISDSWSYTSDLNAQGGITGFTERLDSKGAPTMILTNTAEEVAFNAAHNVNNCQASPCGARWALWPGAIVVDPASDNALVFYSLVFAQPGNFNFQSVGTSVATWQNFASLPQRPTINPPVVAAHPDLLFNQNEPTFGSAALIRAGTLYAYGCGIPTGSGFDKGCRLGRVDPGNVLNRSAWTYYTGSGWSAQINQSQPVFSGNNILSVAWNSFLNKYVAVYSQPFSNNVLLRTAPNPEGPWSGPTLAFVAIAPSSGNIYDALAHLEYAENGGQTIFVSYSRSTPAPFTSEVRLVAVEVAAVAAK
jgi:Domain of unknown function (DUF4185)